VKRWIGFLASGAALCVLALLLLRDAEEPSAKAAVPAAATGALAEPEPAPGQAAAPRPELPSSARIPGRPAGVAPALAAQAAADYRRRARYPRSSAPLRSGEPDPIAGEREVTPIRGRGPGGEEPVLVIFPARSSFTEPEPVVLHAYLARGDDPVAALEITAEVLTEDGRVLGALTFVDDGAAFDSARDGVATTSFVLPAEAVPWLAASYLVQVRALTMEQEERLAAMSFQYARPHARLTGRYRDALADGSLRVAAEVDVAIEGRFHLEGTLYDAGGERPVAWAQTAQALPTGRHWLDLPYYGLILRESGVEGPFLLRYVALSTTTEMPNAKSPVVENAHLTQRYAPTQFTDAPADDRGLMEAADRLEQGGLPNELRAER